jgi:tRNA-specific 2-thiouridylase
MRVVVAMSGGVDSSAAAALLKEAGHEVIGVTLRLNRVERAAQGRCCSPDDIDDARAVADALGIPYYVFETSEQFREQVIEPFVDAYLRGETPVPCAACNRALKFGHLLDRAEALGARLATGHYARIETGPGGVLRLFRGADPSRDQSYFLWQLGPAELSRLAFPVGTITKAEARAVARRAHLPVADKAESQDICFVPDGDAAGFVARHAGDRLPPPGPIVDTAGRVLGEHRGLHAYTVGQRKGLGIAHRLPLYVTELRPESNALVVGPEEAIGRREFEAAEARWTTGVPPAPDEVLTVRVRHRHAGAACRVEVDGARFRVIAVEGPIRAPAPGQAAVLYRGDEVVGGGTIVRSVP